jgi:aspartate beta-hydroxylase
MQFPGFYIKDDNASSWHDPYKYSWVKLLEENFAGIKNEALQVLDEKLMTYHPENDSLAGYGTWNTFFFYKNGGKYIENHKKCPLTSSIIDKIAGVNIAGRTYFSAMTPGIHIKPHCGPHNFKLRTHIGIVTNQDAVIRVADETRPWQNGKCIVFDDSFEHEVWNKSQITRIVLIVDVWNPSLSIEEINALEFIMPEFYNRQEII